MPKKNRENKYTKKNPRSQLATMKYPLSEFILFLGRSVRWWFSCVSFHTKCIWFEPPFCCMPSLVRLLLLDRLSICLNVWERHTCACANSTKLSVSVLFCVTVILNHLDLLLNIFVFVLIQPLSCIYINLCLL